MCPDCRHTLSLRDLVPVLSWISLRGRCRYCKAPISWQYPLVELITTGLIIISYFFWPIEFDTSGITFFITWIITLTGLIALAVYDLKHMLLPDRIVFPLIVLALVSIFIDALLFNGGLESVRTALLGLIFCGGIFYLLFQISAGRWIGGGDVKLGFLLGLIVGGPARALMVIFIASLLGSITSGILLLSGKLKSSHRIPFGPFLITASYIVILFGAEVLGWYKDQFLLP